ncbi:SHOCT domain-containing protein [uncultured Pseudodesulfovibrio sp.]|uniref:SHOCT domain-containing protein n=1 Tax=uncultured Pseudodesulfovibrio sp. TaxID=2035858 RepID=UPI0029C8DC17|nr:SHOCT domain-containing protein [uncultured Pseudodesulfovibrio sp.]
MLHHSWGFMYGPGHGWFMGGFGSLFGLLLIGLLVFMLVRLFQRPTAGTGARRDREDSMEILKRKYANGDISTEEFRKIRSLLKE